MKTFQQFIEDFHEIPYFMRQNTSLRVAIVTVYQLFILLAIKAIIIKEPTTIAGH